MPLALATEEEEEEEVVVPVMQELEVLVGALIARMGALPFMVGALEAAVVTVILMLAVLREEALEALGGHTRLEAAAQEEPPDQAMEQEVMVL